MDYQENRETQYPLERLSSRGSLEILWSTTTRIACLRFCRLQAAIAEQVRGSPVVADPQQRECLLESACSGAPPLRCWRNNAKHTSCGCRCMSRLTKKQNCPIRYEYRELQYADTNAYVHCTCTKNSLLALSGITIRAPRPGRARAGWTKCKFSREQLSNSPPFGHFAGFFSGHENTCVRRKFRSSGVYGCTAIT